MIIEKEHSHYNLEDIEEVCVTLMAFESKFLYKSLGLAVYTNNISKLMSLSETMSHGKTEEQEMINQLLITTGKEKLKEVRVLLPSYKRSSGSTRNEIRFNFSAIKEACNKRGYTNITVSLLIMVMMIRNL